MDGDFSKAVTYSLADSWQQTFVPVELRPAMRRILLRRPN